MSLIWRPALEDGPAESLASARESAPSARESDVLPERPEWDLGYHIFCSIQIS